MKNVTAVVNKNLNRSLTDEDGNELTISLNSGTSIHVLDDYEHRYGLLIPTQMKELLLLSDGLDFFGVKIVPIALMEFFNDEELIAFHYWGNGDFDVINEDNKIFFCDHSIKSPTLVSVSFVEWFLNVLNEIEKFGTLLHPMDFERGFYRSRLDAL